MAPLFKPAMDAAYTGNLEQFKSLIAANQELTKKISRDSHPDLFQFVIEGGSGKFSKLNCSSISCSDVMSPEKANW